MGRRGFGDDAIYFDHSGDCCDARHHKGCPGRWRGAVSLGYGPGVSGSAARWAAAPGRTSRTTSRSVTLTYAGLHTPDGRYTVGQAVQDWLREGLQGRSEKTITLNRDVLKAVVDRIGRTALRELTAHDVRRALTEIAATRSSRTVVVVHNALERAIRHAEANDYVRRNVASLVRPPSGQPGRPSKSLTLDQANTLLAAAEGSPLERNRADDAVAPHGADPSQPALMRYPGCQVVVCPLIVGVVRYVSERRSPTRHPRRRGTQPALRA